MAIILFLHYRKRWFSVYLLVSVRTHICDLKTVSFEFLVSIYMCVFVCMCPMRVPRNSDDIPITVLIYLIGNVKRVKETQTQQDTLSLSFSYERENARSSWQISVANKVLIVLGSLAMLFCYFSITLSSSAQTSKQGG